MAHLNSLRRPLLAALRSPLSPPRHSSARRCFSQSLGCRALDKTAQAEQIRSRQSPDRSLRLAAKSLQMAQSRTATDIGLIPETFIKPTGPNLPSFFREPRATARMLWTLVRRRVRDQVSLFALYVSSPRDGKRFWQRRVKLSRSRIVPTAVALHQRMYRGLAEGNMSDLAKICSDGILHKFQTKIDNRERGEKMQWELVRYHQKPKMVSHRGAKFPTAGQAIRQAVVRISSRQKVTKLRQGKGGAMIPVPGSGKEKDVVEYLVVQRITRDWTEGSWQVWGTTSETPLEQI
ncbi:unnamed protein product [Diplocarpon coronariae]|uniref:Tim44-like domain-containing protein n=1 Tax=Diplocarpon coronariae TaxID=2795749 RepID=A0A218YWH4_9HELO|nr:hypothetical protein B2J93_8718 [Marssonina coronariae]